MSTLTEAQIVELAEHLEQAELQNQAVVKITDQYPDMDYDDAYDIQDRIRQQKESRGIRTVGLKMGLTSFAKMKQMGVDSPIFGFLPETAHCADGGEISTDGLIHPKVEAEVAFVTRTALRGPNCTAEMAREATDFVVAALEIIDSRYENFRFDLRSVVADNTSVSRYVSGSRIAAITDLDLRSMGVVMEKNGEVAQTGAGAAVLGDPAESVAMLANMLAARDQFIPAGTFVLTGGITAAVPVDKGDVITARYQGLGAITVRFV
ncbi:MAG: 2-oxo-3-hexenedioate decarboxylase [Myxococcales bacterium]|nr:2-oxo-3-hexenedioate decarboxylase [Myxococcales bacterium]